MRVYVLSKPDSFVSIITNSSSMLFVANKAQGADRSVDESIPAALRNWFGEIKEVSTPEELYDFAYKYHHVMGTLFYDVIAKDNDFSYGSYEMYDDYHAASRAREAGNDELADSLMTSYRSKMEAARKRWDAKRLSYTRDCVEKLTDRLPIYYYEAGEDNELHGDNDWAMIDALPMTSARLS